MPKLKNNKHEVFCHEYLVDLNATQACRRAGFAEKYANRQATALMARDDIKKRIEELRRIREKKADIKADEILYVLATILRANSSDFVTVGKRNKVTVIPTDEIDEDKLIALAGVKKGAKGAIEVKQYDKLKAAELLMRHLGMLNDKLQVGGKVTHEVDENSLREILRLAGYKQE